MCLFVSMSQPRKDGRVAPVVRNKPYIAYKGVVIHPNRQYFSPYRDAPISVGVVYKSRITVYHRPPPRVSVVSTGLHMSLSYVRARYHGFNVLIALVPPGAEVYYQCNGGEDIAVNEVIYFETKEAAEKWWAENWHMYKDKM